MQDKFIVLIPCAGSGSRIGAALPKQYIDIYEKTILKHTLDVFIGLDIIDSIVIVTNPSDNYIDNYSHLSNKIRIEKIGGETRALSVLNGLNSLNCRKSDWVLVHDAARCCLTKTLVLKMIDSLKYDQVGGILAVKATDTIKEIDLIKVENLSVKGSLNREQIYLAQTPQMFRYAVLKKALTLFALDDNITDDASAIEQLGLVVKIIEGCPTNIKVTKEQDLLLAKFFLNSVIR